MGCACGWQSGVCARRGPPPARCRRDRVCADGGSEPGARRLHRKRNRQASISFAAGSPPPRPTYRSVIESVDAARLLWTASAAVRRAVSERLRLGEAAVLPRAAASHLGRAAGPHGSHQALVYALSAGREPADRAHDPEREQERGRAEPHGLRLSATRPGVFRRKGRCGPAAAATHAACARRYGRCPPSGSGRSPALDLRRATHLRRAADARALHGAYARHRVEHGGLRDRRKDRHRQGLTDGAVPVTPAPSVSR